MSSYDQALLDEAPKASRAQLQQGYDADLLEQPPRRTPSVHHPHSQTPVPLTPGVAETRPQEKITSLSHIPAKPSFWRSRNGIITLFVIAIVVVGAVVGGAVGGTVNKHAHNNAVSSTRSSGPTNTSSPSPSSSIPASNVTAPIGGQSTLSAPSSTPSSSNDENIHVI